MFYLSSEAHLESACINGLLKQEDEIRSVGAPYCDHLGYGKGGCVGGNKGFTVNSRELL